VALCLTLGALITIGTYLETPKRFLSKSSILIRSEKYDERFLQRTLRSALDEFNSDMSLARLRNELSLYPGVEPTEFALRRLRAELQIQALPSSISVRFLSQNPKEAQAVVAYAVGRLDEILRTQLEQTHNGRIDALRGRLDDIDDAKAGALTALSVFRGKHPVLDRIVRTHPAHDVMTAELALQRAQGSVRHVAAPKHDQLEAAIAEALRTLTEGHPYVQRLRQDLADLGSRPVDEADIEAVRHAQAQLAMARQRQVAGTLEPDARKQWAELTLMVSTYEGQYREILGRLEAAQREKVEAVKAHEANFYIRDFAKVPEMPDEPNRNKFAFVGSVVTAVLTLLLAGSLEATRQTFASAAELHEQTGFPILGDLPPIKKDVHVL
jgi:uncharacterized protein involved in exopolysaccharide biosynthesis